MSAAKRKIDKSQQELPIEGVKPQPIGMKPARRTAKIGGNGAQHVVAEEVAKTTTHRPFNPNKLEAGLHTRVDRGFLDYASYVIRDRAIPNLADGLKPVQRRILW